MFKRKEKNIEKLRTSFGKLKDDNFNFELIEKYFKYKKNSNAFQILSDRTCDDLDFDELFMFIDRTHSKIGQQFLYNRLRVIPTTHNREYEEKLIQKLTSDSNLRVDIQKQLQKLNKDSGFHVCSLFQIDYIKQPKWFFIIRLLSFTSLLSLILLPIRPELVFLLAGVFLFNFGFHYWNKKNIYQYLGSIPQLLLLNNIASNLYKNKHFKNINPSLHESIEVIDQVRNRMSFFRLEAKLQGDLEALFWGVFELLKILFLLEPLLLFGVLNRLNKKRTEIENVFSFIGQIDSLISISSLRKGLSTFCIPEINITENKIIANDIFHPLIVNCVSNSISVSEKSILLTGSNMSGKTSFIRTIGLNVITGLTINTCFARSITIPHTRIFSAIRISDDLLNDKSYYFEEVLAIKKMIQESTSSKQSLFLLDEIFKGTNTIERISAGKAILSVLSNAYSNVLVSTHDVELADMLSYEYELYNFSEIINNSTIDFDYKLKKGKLQNRNAIKILQINDYPKSVVTEALEISKILDEINRGH